jgi:integrase
MGEGLAHQPARFCLHHPVLLRPYYVPHAVRVERRTITRSQAKTEEGRLVRPSQWTALGAGKPIALSHRSAISNCPIRPPSRCGAQHWPRMHRFLRSNRRLPRIRFHDLRHAHATHLLAAGVHPKVRLGNSKVGITLDTYSPCQICRRMRPRSLTAP